MRILLIYNFVHHGNTEKIAKVIADELKAKMVKPTEEEVNKLSEYDLIGGINKGRPNEEDCRKAREFAVSLLE